MKDIEAILQELPVNLETNIPMSILYLMKIKIKGIGENRCTRSDGIKRKV